MNVIPQLIYTITPSRNHLVLVQYQGDSTETDSDGLRLTDMTNRRRNEEQSIHHTYSYGNLLKVFLLYVTYLSFINIIIIITMTHIIMWYFMLILKRILVFLIYYYYYVFHFLSLYHHLISFDSIQFNLIKET